MKTALYIGFIVGLLPCALTAATGGQRSVPRPAKIAFSEEDFRKGPAHKTKEITLALGDKLMIDLGSNPSTGYSWDEKPENTDPAVLKQVQHERKGAPKNIPGAGGSQSWIFQALKSGTTALHFSYSRPWEGGEKGIWTLKVTVKVQ